MRLLIALILTSLVLPLQAQPKAAAWIEGPRHDDFRISLKPEALHYPQGDTLRCALRIEYLGKEPRLLETLTDREPAKDLASLLRLAVTDSEGKTRDIGVFLNLNRGLIPTTREFQPGEKHEVKMEAFLGYQLVKGKAERPLAPGRYRLHAHFGDRYGGWDAHKTEQTPASAQATITIQKPDKLTLKDLAWLEGTWDGGLGPTKYREVWDRPEGNSMMGMFRWTQSGRPLIYEFLLLEEDEEGVVLRFRHFTPGHKPKEKADPIALRVHRLGPRHLEMRNLVKNQSPISISYRLTKNGVLEVEVIQLRVSRTQKLKLELQQRK